MKTGSIEFDSPYKAGAALEWVQWVQLNPWILRSLGVNDDAVSVVNSKVVEYQLAMHFIG